MLGTNHLYPPGKQEDILLIPENRCIFRAAEMYQSWSPFYPPPTQRYEEEDSLHIFLYERAFLLPPQQQGHAEHEDHSSDDSAFVAAIVLFNIALQMYMKKSSQAPLSPELLHSVVLLYHQAERLAARTCLSEEQRCLRKSTRYKMSVIVQMAALNNLAVVNYNIGDRDRAMFYFDTMTETMNKSEIMDSFGHTAGDASLQLDDDVSRFLLNAYVIGLQSTAPAEAA
jgi:hypothetical protein